MPHKHPFMLLIAVMICISSLHAQTLYNFKYHFQGEEGMEYYNAFMVRYDDGTGFIRVNYTDSTTGKKYLVEMQMEETYDINDKTKKVDSSILYFIGIDPVVLSGDTSEGYDPDIYVFEKQKSSEYYDPLSVLSVGDNDEVTSGDFDEVNLIEANELTEPFVLQFFSQKDEFYQNLFKTTVRHVTDDEKKVTLHLMVVANTNDPDIGSTCTLDKDRTLKTFSDLCEFMSFKLDVKTIFGDSYNKQSVEDAIATLNPAPRDIVVFYYSGHGFSKNDNYQYPYMELRSKSFQSLNENSINIEDIYNRIKQKKANLVLVISDCCNTLPETPPAVSGEIALTRSSSLGWNLNNCLQLFLPAAPVSILVTAAQKGEMSAGNNSYGGFFTSNFRSALVNYLSPVFTLGSITWQKLIDEAKTQTSKKAFNTLCNLPDGTRARCVQHPVYKMY